MASRHRGADALVKAMVSAGVRHIFTLSGNHIMPIFDAAFDAGIALIHTRHEAAAVHMADAWARLTGEPGIALVTSGPGHANALGALYTAAMAESPVVLLSGHAPNNQLGMGGFQEMRQAEIAAPLAKAAFTSARAGDVTRDFVRAIREARSGRPGPVHLSLPTDCLEDDADMKNVPRAETLSNEAMALDAGVADGILEQLQRAPHPLILAGPALMTRRGRQSTARLQDILQIPVIGMESPRGIADPSLGAFAQILAQADCVLLLGKRLDFTLKFGMPPAFDAYCEFLQIDAEVEEIERTQRALHARLSASAIAEPFAAAEMLARCARAKPAAKSGWLEETRVAIAYRPAAWDTAKSSQTGRLHPLEALRPLQALLDGHQDSVFISDGGEFGQWAQACLSAPNRVINGVAGSIGAALPFALAARIAKPDAPVIAVMGDGTFGFHPGEIDTAVRYGLPFVCVVGNDARWNAEYQIQLREYGRDRLHGCELLPTRYDRVATAFGGYGELVTSATEVGPTAQRAMMSGLPACINILIEGLAAPSINRSERP
jgi:thiamine pyrophosphate-dependent acetolactate synthase large subunit-like protein